jgi:hypothetical protein
MTKEIFHFGSFLAVFLADIAVKTLDFFHTDFLVKSRSVLPGNSLLVPKIKFWEF